MTKRSRKPTSGGSGGSRPHGNDCEHRSGPVAGTALIQGVTFARKAVLYAEVDGLAMFEGDIVLGTVNDVRNSADAQAASGPVLMSIGITGQQFRWPNATIPYEIDPALPNQQRVTDAIAHWQAHTTIRFVPRTAANADYVRFQPGGGCSSQVGRRGGMQNVTLGPACTTGNAIHEIGHTVGLWHEQSREDRDTFVQIVWANIDPAMQHNFSQQVTDGDDLGAYDYGSIMHYPAMAFSINNQATIIPRQPIPPGVVMGQRTGLSAGDIAGVHAMYPGGGGTLKEVPKDPVTDPVTRKELTKDPITEPIITRKEIAKDPASEPVTRKELTKDPIFDPTVKEIRKDPIRDTMKEAGKDPFRDTAKEGAFDPGPTGPFPGPSPFVLGAPGRAGMGMADQVAAAAEQVQQLGEALAALEQQMAELAAAYDAAVQGLAALQGGQG